MFENIRKKIEENKTFIKILNKAGNLYEYLYSLRMLKREKKNLLIFLSLGLEHGSSPMLLLETKFKEYLGLDNFFMATKIRLALDNMETDGMDLGQSFVVAGIFSSSEALIYQAISKRSPSDALEYINSSNKHHSDFKYAISMLIFPVVAVLIGYIVFMPEIKDFTLQMLEPVNSLSTTPIPMPFYFEDRTIFVLALMSLLGTAGSVYAFVSYLKVKNPKILFKTFKLFEREFIINSFTLIEQLMNSGLSLVTSIEIIVTHTEDPVLKKIYSDVLIDFEEGNSLSSSLRKYLSDNTTLSFIVAGESSNMIEKTVKTSLAYNELLHKKLIAKMLVWLPLTGEMVMTIVLLLPLLEIINLTTSGAMNFTL